MRTKASVLIAEDEPQARESLRALLEDEGYSVLCAPDGVEASRILSQSAVEAALVDIRMPLKDGLTLLRELKESPAPPAVLIMTAYGTSAAAIEAMALGAFDYLTKPLNFDELLIQLQRAIEDRRRTSELESYRIEEDAQQDSEIVGSSPAMQKLYKLIGQVAVTDSTVLIRGESGTGKEVVARAIHKHSLRASRRLVKVNCASIPERSWKRSCSDMSAERSPEPRRGESEIRIRSRREPLSGRDRRTCPLHPGQTAPRAAGPLYRATRIQSDNPSRCSHPGCNQL
jgi:DNA-binding NtrC family response regulator